MATGLPKVPDCEPPVVRLPEQPSQLEQLARALDADVAEVRWWLREEVERRRRERVEEAARL